MFTPRVSVFSMRGMQRVEPVPPTSMPARAAAPSRALRRVTALVLIAGLGLTLWAARSAQMREQQRIDAEFQAESHALARAVEREMALFSSVLLSLGELHSLSESISAADFAEFAKKGLLHQKNILGAFAFAQRIPHELRTALETQSNPAHPQPPIVEFGPDGLQPAGPRPEYYPITYQSPEEGIGLPIGFDLASLPGQLDAIARMAASGEVTIGAALAAHAPDAPPAFLVCAPIGQGPAFSGFTSAPLWPQQLLDRAAQQTRIQRIQVTLFDPRYGRPPPARTALHRVEQTIALADQRWTLRVEAGSEYRGAKSSNAPRLIALGGGVATLLLAWALSLLAGRAREIERAVRQRTAELEAANQQLAQEMDERARLESALQDAATREKQRIGQDLHDSLGQKLTGAVYLARALEPDVAPAGRESVAKLVDLLKDAVAQVRRTARGLAPLEVGEDGLASALRRLAEETCDVFNIACSVAEQGRPLGLQPEAAVQLYYLAQEAVHNAIRHGHARNIQIELAARELRVIDDGCGFDPRATTAGAGLRIMRHRAQRAGGRLEIESTAAGSTIAVRW